MGEDPVPPRCLRGEHAGRFGIDGGVSDEECALVGVGDALLDERHDRDGDLDGGADRSEVGGAAVVAGGCGGEEQVAENVGTNLVRRANIKAVGGLRLPASARVGSRVRSVPPRVNHGSCHFAEAVVDAMRDGGGQDCTEFGHAVVEVGDPDGAVFDGAAVALLERGVGVPFRPPLRQRRQTRRGSAAAICRTSCSNSPRISGVSMMAPAVTIARTCATEITPASSASSVPV